MKPSDRNGDNVELPPALEEKARAVVEQFLEALDRGERPDRESIVSAHPDIAAVLAKRLKSVELLHWTAGAASGKSATSLLSRLGPVGIAHRLRCPHCQQPLQLVLPAAEAKCDQCGSSFSIDVEASPIEADHELPDRLGKFDLLEVLGEGAFGVVYRGIDAELDRMAAIKVPRARYFSTAEEEHRFLREARAAAALRHPGIVQVYEIARAGGVPCIVSELVEGCTLEDVIHEGRPPFRESATIVASAADAVQYAHEQSIVHRDLKPGNILLDEAGVPHVADFGLARHDDGEVTVTLDGQVLGTPAYMSPEQARGDQRIVDARADVYSLGAVLYELLTGERPFSGAKRMVIHQVIHDDPLPPRRLDHHIPRDLETVCLKAMAKEPSRRYQSAAELAADLRRYLDGRPVTARPIGSLERLWRWCRRDPALAGTIAASALAILGGLVGFIFWQQAKHHELETEIERTNLAIREQKAAVVRAEAHRLTALSSATLTKDPTLALLLALEGADRHPGPIADNALLAALAAIRLEKTLEGHTHWVYDADFSPDGSRVVTASRDETARIWDTETGVEVERFVAPELLHRVGYSVDGSSVFVAGLRNVYVLDARTGVERSRLHFDSRIGDMRFSSDHERFAAVCHDGTVAIIEPAEQAQHSFRVPRGEFFSVGIHPREDRVVLASREPARATVWDFGEETPLADLTSAIPPAEFAEFDPSDDRILGVAYHSVGLLVNAETRSQTALKGHRRTVVSIAFSPDGNVVATASRDGTARVWDAHSGLQLAVLSGHRQDVVSVAFSRDGGRVITTSLDETAKIWRLSTEFEIETAPHAAPVAAPLIDVDGALGLSWRGADVEIWDLSTDARRVLHGHTDLVNSACFSRDGLRIASTSRDSTVRVWHVEKGTAAHVLPLPAAAVCATFSPEGDRVAVGGRGSMALIWDLTSDPPSSTALSGHENWVDWISFSSDGTRVVTGSHDGYVRAWNARDGSLVWRSAHGSNRAWVLFATFVSDDALVVTGSHDNTACILDAETGRVMTRLEGHTGRVLAATYHARAHLALTRSQDGTVRAWNATTGVERLRLDAPEGELRFATFSRDGRSIITLSGDAVLRSWPIDPLPLARAWKPRRLTFEEMDLYEIGTPEERASLRQTRRLEDAFDSARLAEQTRARQPGYGRFELHSLRALDRLARAQSNNGSYRDAILTLERAMPRTNAYTGLRDRLRTYRERYAPDFASYASIDAWLGSAGSPRPADHARVAEFRKVAEGGDARSRIAYLEGRLLQRSGSSGDALAVFETLHASDAESPEPVLRIAECLVATGDPSAAASRIRTALESERDGDERLRDEWLRLSLVDLGRSPNEVLERLPRSSSANVRRLLEQLAESATVRINCGGSEYETADGTRWEGDCFATAGYRSYYDGVGGQMKPFTDEIAGTEDDVLYQTGRWFPRETIQPTGYRIPLPPGSYRVTLHFCEIWPGFQSSGGRVFDVRLEGRMLLEAYDPWSAGYATADRKTFDVDVLDGALDIELRRRAADPTVSAIDVRALARR